MARRSVEEEPCWRLFKGDYPVACIVAEDRKNANAAGKHFCLGRKKLTTSGEAQTHFQRFSGTTGSRALRFFQVTSVQRVDILLPAHSDQ